MANPVNKAGRWQPRSGSESSTSAAGHTDLHRLRVWPAAVLLLQGRNDPQDHVWRYSKKPNQQKTTNQIKPTTKTHQKSNCSALAPPSHIELFQSRQLPDTISLLLPWDAGSRGFLFYSLEVSVCLLQTAFMAGLILLLPNLVHTHTARGDKGTPGWANLNPSRGDKGALCAFAPSTAPRW